MPAYCIFSGPGIHFGCGRRIKDGDLGKNRKESKLQTRRSSTILFLVGSKKPYEPWKDYIKLLIDCYESKGFSVDVYDVNQSFYYNIKESKHRYFFVHNKFTRKIPPLHALKNIVLLHKFLRNKTYDAAFLFSIRDEYLFCSQRLRNSTRRLFGYIYGSDFSRSPFKTIKSIVYSKLDLIFFATEEYRKKFNSYYNHRFKNNSIILELPILKLRLIDKIKSKQVDGIHVLVGSNSSPNEQHYQIIAHIDFAKFKNVNFIFLLNSGNDTYKNRLIAFIDKLNITDYTIISERLSDEEYLDLMAKINVHLNLRKTDHLNSSMLEFLYSQAVEIIGGWLPYNDLDEWGVFTIRIDDFSALTNALERAISIVGSALDNRLYKNRLIIKSRFYPDDVLKKWSSLIN